MSEFIYTFALGLVTLAKSYHSGLTEYSSKMSADGHVSKSVAPATYAVDDAVGMGESCRFVVIVNRNPEKQHSVKNPEMGVADRLPAKQENRI